MICLIIFFPFFTDVPREKSEVIKVTDRVSYVKKTKWGFSFDVLCEPVQTDPNHLAYTGMYLEHHTDMNYLEKSPGIFHSSVNHKQVYYAPKTL